MHVSAARLFYSPGLYLRSGRVERIPDLAASGVLTQAGLLVPFRKKMRFFLCHVPATGSSKAGASIQWTPVTIVRRYDHSVDHTAIFSHYAFVWDR